MSKESAIKTEPTNEKDEHFAIASILVKDIATSGSYKKVKEDKKDVDEYHIKADMTLTCNWHDHISGQWKSTEIKVTKNYNHSKGERVPDKNSPVVFDRTSTGGFTL